MARPDGSGDSNSSSGSSSQQQTIRRRILGQHVLPLSRAPPPSPEVTVEEGTHLFNSFMFEELERAQVHVPTMGIEIPSTHYTISFASPLTEAPGVRGHSVGDSEVCFDAADCPISDTAAESITAAAAATVSVPSPTNYRRLGREIRRYADDFATSAHGQKIKEKANEVDLGGLDYQSLQDLLSGVFFDGQFSLTTIIAVFVFCSTLVIRALRDPLLKISKNIIDWCFKFIQDGVCTVVQEQGGWEAVVDGMVGRLLKIGTTFLIASAALAALLFLWKK